MNRLEELVIQLETENTELKQKIRELETEIAFWKDYVKEEQRIAHKEIQKRSKAR